jgi:ribulose-5-phosphate 4-epimerase/fuculose-1-phosphate aldolase
MKPDDTSKTPHTSEQAVDGDAFARKTDGGRPHAAALELATALMAEHGLCGWRIKLDHARRRAGLCDFSAKVISLSRHYVRHAEPDHIRDTILHEIAHALVGPRHGHDAVWRRKAREIGCTATRCHNLSF